MRCQPLSRFMRQWYARAGVMERCCEGLLGGLL